MVKKGHNINSEYCGIQKALLAEGEGKAVGKSIARARIRTIEICRWRAEASAFAGGGALYRESLRGLALARARARARVALEGTQRKVVGTGAAEAVGESGEGSGSPTFGGLGLRLRSVCLSRSARLFRELESFSRAARDARAPERTKTPRLGWDGSKSASGSVSAEYQA